jgi:hypothetical protein
MILLLIHLLLVLLVAAVLYWAVTKVLGVLPVPEPFRTIVLVIFVLIVLLIVIDIFVPFAGGQRLLW